MRINQNVAALRATRQLGVQTDGLKQSLVRLSSGLRLNKAADDSAGMAVSTSMRHQMAAYAQAGANVQDGIHLLRTAEGGFHAVTDILHRLRVLTVQAANDTLSASDRTMIQAEVDHLLAEIDRQVDTTEYNGRSLIGRKAHQSLSDLINAQAEAKGAPRLDPGATVSVVAPGQITLANAALELQIAQSSFGEFGPIGRLITTQGFTTAADDDAQRILYEPGVTSDTMLRIDGVDISFGDMFNPAVATVSPPTLVGTDTVRAVRTFANGAIQVTRDVKLSGSFVTMSFAVTNLDGQDHDVGIRVLLDTMLANNDGAIINENGGQLPGVTFYTAADMPQRLDVFEGVLNPNLQSSAIASDDPEVLTPDVFGAVNWPLASGNYDYPGAAGAPIGGDSAISYQYLPKTLAAGETQTMAAVKYGLTRAGSIPDVDVDRFQNGDELVLHVGAGMGQTMNVQRADLSTANLGLEAMTLTGTPEEIGRYLTRLDEAMAYVSEERARLGAQMNELSAQGSMLQQSEIDITTAQSRIRDADVAAESAQMARRQILSQASASLLAQANSTSKLALSLLAAA